MSIQSCFTGGILPGYAQHDPHLRQLYHQRRSAEAEEGQRDTGVGDQVGDHADVQKHLHRQQGDDAHGGQGAELIPGVEGQPVPPQDEHGEQDEHEGPADIAQLLHQDGEHKVVLRLRHIVELALAVAQTHAEQAARAHGQQGLTGLPAVAPEVGPGVQPQVDPVGHIGGVGDDPPHRGGHESDARGEPAPVDARRPQHRGAPRQDQQGAGQVGLLHHQQGDASSGWPRRGPAR